jgi:uncharacterized membrane protein
VITCAGGTRTEPVAAANPIGRLGALRTGNDGGILGVAGRGSGGSDHRARRRHRSRLRPAGLGALAGLMMLALIVVALGPLLDRVPLHLLQFVIGILLLLFGMRWLRKAILRSAGVIPLHDEAVAFAAETAQLREQARLYEARLDWLAAITSFKAILLEGLEVVS